MLLQTLLEVPRINIVDTSKTAEDDVLARLGGDEFGILFYHCDLDNARAVIHDTPRRADILFPSLDEARLLSGLEDLAAVMDFYGGKGAEVLALKCGEMGAVVEARGERKRFLPPEVTVVDTSGAGDTFVGSFLARLASGEDPFYAAD